MMEVWEATECGEERGEKREIVEKSVMEDPDSEIVETSAVEDRDSGVVELNMVEDWDPEIVEMRAGRIELEMNGRA